MLSMNNLEQELIRYVNNVDFIHVTFMFAKRRVPNNIAHRYGTEIFTSNASIFARSHQVFMPRMPERFEHKPVRSLLFLNGNRGLKYLLITQFLTE